MATKTSNQTVMSKTGATLSIPWVYYTIKSLAQWLEYDQPGASALRNKDRDGFRRWMAFYRISRNFHGLGDKDYKVVDKIMCNVLESSKRLEALKGSDDALVSEVQCLSTNFGSERLTSAASKLLYLARPEKGIIYDRNARVGLNLQEQVSYKEYVCIWNKSLQECKPMIEGAIQQCLLLRDDVLPLHLADASTSRSVLNKPWFIRRVFDICLWHTGDKKIRKTGGEQGEQGTDNGLFL